MNKSLTRLEVSDYTDYRTKETQIRICKKDGSRISCDKKDVEELILTLQDWLNENKKPEEGLAIGSSMNNGGIVFHKEPFYKGWRYWVCDYLDSEEPLTWEDAKEFCESCKGWRLPTIRELSFLYEFNQSKDLCKGFRYWTSEEFDNYGDDLRFAWAQNFNNGEVMFYDKRNVSGVRAVSTFDVM